PRKARHVTAAAWPVVAGLAAAAVVDKSGRAVSMSPWTTDDDEARRLLDERIDSYDVDDAISIWDRFLRWLDDALGVNVDASGTGGVVIQILLVLAVGVVIFVLIRYFRPSVSPDAVD